MKALAFYVIFGCLSIVIAAPPVSHKKITEDNNVDNNEKDSDIKENLVIFTKLSARIISFSFERRHNIFLFTGRLHGIS